VSHPLRLSRDTRTRTNGMIHCLLYCAFRGSEINCSCVREGDSTCPNDAAAPETFLLLQSPISRFFRDPVRLCHSSLLRNAVLARVAFEHGLQWRPNSTLYAIPVRRLSDPISLIRSPSLSDSSPLENSSMVLFAPSSLHDHNQREFSLLHRGATR